MRIGPDGASVYIRLQLYKDCRTILLGRLQAGLRVVQVSAAQLGSGLRCRESTKDRKPRCYDLVGSCRPEKPTFLASSKSGPGRLGESWLVGIVRPEASLVRGGMGEQGFYSRHL